MFEDKKLASIAIFAFNRPDNLKNLMESLLKCPLSQESDIYIFIDGARNYKEKVICEQVHNVASSYVNRFKSININASNKNFGLATSLVRGITRVFEGNDRVIVLEDDLILSENFVVYMNKALSFYSQSERVGSVSAFTSDFEYETNLDTYVHPRPCSWGWGTWKDRWENCIWDYKPASFGESLKLRFKSRAAGQDVYRMFNNNLRGKINSWAIMWTMHHIKNNLVTIYPFKTKVKNNGYGDSATHCIGVNPFPTNFKSDSNDTFAFEDNLNINLPIIKKVNFYHSNYYKLLFKIRRFFRD